MMVGVDFMEWRQFPGNAFIMHDNIILLNITKQRAYWILKGMEPLDQGEI